MDQSESNKTQSDQPKGVTKHIEVPKRGFTMEFFVGIFGMVGLAAAGYQAIGLGGFSFNDSDKYEIQAEFDNVSGLKPGAPVEIAGVPIGEISRITLKDPEALVTLKLRSDIKIFDDDVASVRTQGIIGDRYVKISRGASEVAIKPGETLFETESVVDIEDIIGKIVHSLDGGEDEDSKDLSEEKK